MSRFIMGGLIISAPLAYLIYRGMRRAIVYFVTPSELKGQEKSSLDKFLRIAGMVVPGPLKKDQKDLIKDISAEGNHRCAQTLLPSSDIVGGLSQTGP